MKIQNPLIKKKDEKQNKTKKPNHILSQLSIFNRLLHYLQRDEEKKKKAEQECHAKIIMQKIKSNAVVCLET